MEPEGWRGSPLLETGSQVMNLLHRKVKVAPRISHDITSPHAQSGRSAAFHATQEGGGDR